jgi:hypothetical protein
MTPAVIRHVSIVSDFDSDWRRCRPSPPCPLPVLATPLAPLVAPPSTTAPQPPLITGDGRRRTPTTLTPLTQYCRHRPPPLPSDAAAPSPLHRAACPSVVLCRAGGPGDVVAPCRHVTPAVLPPPPRAGQTDVGREVARCALIATRHSLDLVNQNPQNGKLQHQLKNGTKILHFTLQQERDEGMKHCICIDNLKCWALIFSVETRSSVCGEILPCFHSDRN